MTRHYTPDPDSVLTALAGRLDVLERASTGTVLDLAALGRGLADLTTQLRTTLTHPSPVQAGSGGQEERGQPDWLDPGLDSETATALLGVATRFLDRIGVHHGLVVPIVCWPLHPGVVVDVLALAGERSAAYASPSPTGVSEWLTRWLPATRDRVTGELAECVADRGHRHASRTYDLTGFDPASAAGWWATDRATPAVRAFGLTPLT